MKTRLFLLGFSLFLGSLHAQPSNDLFRDRIMLSGTNITVNGDNHGAGREPGEDLDNHRVVYSVWYGWTSPGRGTLYASVVGMQFNMSVRVFRGEVVNDLVLAAQSPDGGIPVDVGETLAIQVGGIPEQFTLDLSLEIPEPTSSNDDFRDGLEISVPDYHFEGSMFGASIEPGEPRPNGATRSLWWKVTPSENGVISVLPSTPQFFSYITLYEGTTLNGLLAQSALSNYRYPLQAGHEYAVQLSSAEATGGRAILDTVFTPSTNDSFAGSARLEGTNATYVGSWAGATLEPNEPKTDETSTLWGVWAPPFTGHARVTLESSTSYQSMSVYTGSALDQLQTVGIGYRILEFLAIAGTDYHIQMAGGVDEFKLTVELLPFQPAPNDAFASARKFFGWDLGSALEPSFDIGEATAEIGEPAHLDGAVFKSLWWKWTAPTSGRAGFDDTGSLTTNVTLAVYQGDRIEALRLVGKKAHALDIPVFRGQTYYIAVVGPSGTIGDVTLRGGMSLSSSAPQADPGNVLKEPSWEGTALFNAQYWMHSGDLGGAVGEPSGCDGTTWPFIGNGAMIWQDFPSIPLRSYRIRFAMRAKSNYVGGGKSDRQVSVLWDDKEIGTAVLPAAEASIWHWPEFHAMASQTTSRITFAVPGSALELDAFSVVPADAPPGIVNQPTSVNAISGGTAVLAVGVTGSEPLTYEWYFNGALYVTNTTPALIINPVFTNFAGIYQAVVFNNFGSITSAPVTLTVEAPQVPVILWQPYGDSVAEGGYYSFGVVAAGSGVLNYQWFKDRNPVDGATNRTLVLAAVAKADAGTYTVRIQNGDGSVWSLDAKLWVTDSSGGGGKVFFSNYELGPMASEVPIFDLDGLTRLSGPDYRAQLYAGPSLEYLRPVGQPSTFNSGFFAGIFSVRTLSVPTVPTGGSALVQVRAWDWTKGSTYEEARVLGARVGKSELFNVTLGDTPFPAPLDGLQSFSLSVGLPQFVTGQISLVERRPDGGLVWAHKGELGYRYLIEKSAQGFDWHPFQLITNLTSTVTFTDSVSSNSVVGFYRSRILD